MIRIKNLLMAVLSIAVFAMPVFAQKKFAKVEIEVSFNREYNIFKNANISFIFLDNDQVIIVEKNNAVTISTYQVKNNKIRIEKGIDGKKLNITIIDEMSLKYGKETLERE